MAKNDWMVWSAIGLAGLLGLGYIMITQAKPAGGSGTNNIPVQPTPAFPEPTPTPTPTPTAPVVEEEKPKEAGCGCSSN